MPTLDIASQAVILIKKREKPYRREHARSRTIENLSLIQSKYPFIETYCHNTLGKPIIPEYPYIDLSISHSLIHLAVSLSNHSMPIGIDIEDAPQRALKVWVKFLTSEELEIINKTFFTVGMAWSAKEATFKLLSEHNLVSFKKDIIITEITHLRNTDTIPETFSPIFRVSIDSNLNNLRQRSYCYLYIIENSILAVSSFEDTVYWQLEML